MVWQVAFLSYSVAERPGANSIARLEAHLPAEQEELQAVGSQLPPNEPCRLSK